MLVYFYPKLEIRKMSFYYGLILFLSVICFIFGFWKGSPIEMVYSFEPEMCSVKPSNGTSGSFYLQLDSAENISCNESMRNLDTSNLGEYYVEFSYLFSLGNWTLLEADWIERLTADIVFQEGYEVPVDDPTLNFEAELMFFNETSNENKWKPLASTKETRQIQCSYKWLFPRVVYGCTIIPIFQLSAVDYDKYSLNIRFSGRSSRNITYISGMKHLSDMHLVLRHENPGFSEVMADLKTCFFPFMLLAHMTYAENHRPMNTLVERFLWFHSVVAIVVNVPFEYFWKWMHNPIWTLFATMAELTFQTSLFIMWIFFITFFSCDGVPPMNIAYYRPYILLLAVWYSLTAYDEYVRWAVQYDPFFSPWGNCITAFKELALYDFMRSLVTPLTGLLLIYQFCSIFFRVFMKKSVLMYHFGHHRWFDVNTSTVQLLTFSLCSCVSSTMFRFSLNQLREIHFKVQVQSEDSLEKYFVEQPNLLTLFLGMTNVLSIALLVLMPKLNMLSDNKLTLRVFGDLDEFKDHIIYCCQHSPSQGRLSFCQVLQKKNGTKSHYGACCLSPRLIVTCGKFQNKIMNVKVEENCSDEKDEHVAENEELLAMEFADKMALAFLKHGSYNF